MVSKKNPTSKKIFFLILFCSVLCLSFIVALLDINIGHFGICIGCGWMQRLCFSFFHASVLHCVLNLWCLISILRVYDIPYWLLLLTFVISCITPNFFLSNIPTVGLSSICYVLLGFYFLSANSKALYSLCMLVSLGMGFFFPSVNAMIHIYGYISGIFIGLIYCLIGKYRI